MEVLNLVCHGPGTTSSQGAQGEPVEHFRNGAEGSAYSVQAEELDQVPLDEVG